MTQRMADRIVPMEGELTIRTALAVHKQLLQACEAPGDVVVDCAKADEIDLSFLQMLVAAERLLGADGRRLSLSPPSCTVLSDAMTRAGIAPDSFNWGGVS